jgi:D-alanyl-D-alanine dipeptidase
MWKIVSNPEYVASAKGSVHNRGAVDITLVDATGKS